MKYLTLAAAFALALSFEASGNSYSISSASGASCSQTEDTGSALEFGTELDTVTQQGKVFAKWVYKIGQGNLSKINCNRLFVNEAEIQELKLERLQLEIAKLKERLSNPEVAEKSVASGDDW